MDKDDIQYNLMFLEESPRLDGEVGSVFRAAMRELQRLGYAETYTAGRGKTAWRLTDQGRQAAERIPAQRRADFEEAKHIAAESGGLAGEWWLRASAHVPHVRGRRAPSRYLAAPGTSSVAGSSGDSPFADVAASRTLTIRPPPSRGAAASCPP